MAAAQGGFWLRLEALAPAPQWPHPLLCSRLACQEHGFSAVGRATLPSVPRARVSRLNELRLLVRGRICARQQLWIHGHCKRRSNNRRHLQDRHRCPEWWLHAWSVVLCNRQLDHRAGLQARVQRRHVRYRNDVERQRGKSHHNVGVVDGSCKRSCLLPGALRCRWLDR